MALHDVYLRVQFLDAAERTAEIRYLLLEQYDDVALNMEDVTDNAAALITGLNALTWDGIPRYFIEVETVTGALGPNVAANNQIRAFSRMTTAVTDEQASLEVPAWDDTLYDQDSNNLLSPAYNAAVLAGVVPWTRDPVTKEQWTVNWSQSRTRKSGVKLA